MGRYAGFHIVVGTNGTGKSTAVAKFIDASHFRNVIVYLEGIDATSSPFGKHPVIPLMGYKGGKVCIDADEIGFVPFITAIDNSYRNGVLVLDEAGMYTDQMLEKGGEPIMPLKRVLKQRRKYNVETYMIFHSVAEIPIRLLKWCSTVILFHQTDKFGHKAGFIPRMDELNAMAARVSRTYFAGNKYYCEYLKLSLQ